MNKEKIVILILVTVVVILSFLWGSSVNNLERKVTKFENDCSVEKAELQGKLDALLQRCEDAIRRCGLTTDGKG